MGIEGGHAIEDSLPTLREFLPARRALHDADLEQHQQLGRRNACEKKHGGLSDLGKKSCAR
jgi:hypothetical protein